MFKQLWQSRYRYLWLLGLLVIVGTITVIIPFLTRGSGVSGNTWSDDFSNDTYIELRESTTTTAGVLQIMSPTGSYTEDFSDANYNESASTTADWGLDYLGSGKIWQNLGTPNFASSSWVGLGYGTTNDTPYLAVQNNTNVSVWQYNVATDWTLLGDADFAVAASNVDFTVQSDTPYLAFTADEDSNKVTVMKYSGGAWAAVGARGFSSSTAAYLNIESWGADVYVAYRDAGVGNRITVQKYDAGNWTPVGTVGFTTSSVGEVSLAISGAGVPYVAFTDSDYGNKLAVVRYNSGTGAWDGVGEHSISDDSAVDIVTMFDGGTPEKFYVAYSDTAADTKLTVKKYVDEAWSAVGSAGVSAGMAKWISMYDVDSDWQPVVAYQESLDYAQVLKYNTAAGAWTALGVTGSEHISPGTINSYVSLTRQPSSPNRFLVAFINSSSGSVTVRAYPYYAASSTGVSKSVDTHSVNIISATLTATDELSGQSVAYYLSNESTTFNQVTSSEAYTFPTTGSDVRWKAVFTSDGNSSARVSNIQVDYGAAYPFLASATSTAITPGNTFTWSSVSVSTIIPSNTSITLDIIDAGTGAVASCNNCSDYELANGANSIDISDINSGNYSSIKLQANMSTTLETSTPAIDSWEVGWIPINPQRCVFSNIIIVPAVGELPADGSSVTNLEITALCDDGRIYDRESLDMRSQIVSGSGNIVLPANLEVIGTGSSTYRAGLVPGPVEIKTFILASPDIFATTTITLTPPALDLVCSQHVSSTGEAAPAGGLAMAAGILGAAANLAHSMPWWFYLIAIAVLIGIFYQEDFDTHSRRNLKKGALKAIAQLSEPKRRAIFFGCLAILSAAMVLSYAHPYIVAPAYGNALVGDFIQYSCEYKNIGTVPLTNLNIKNPIPTGVTVLGDSLMINDATSTNATTTVADGIKFFIGNVPLTPAVGSSGKVSFDVLVGEAARPTVTNSVFATYQPPENGRVDRVLYTNITNPTCNGAALDEGEVCDAAWLSNKTCSSPEFGLGFVTGTLGCLSNCSGYDTSHCSNCGNNTTTPTAANAGEVCDGTDLGVSSTCAAFGYATGTVSCLADCSGYNTSTCSNCGNNIINAGEACDSDVLPAGATCVSKGFDGGSLKCGAACQFDTSLCSNTPVTRDCGNGVVNAGEDCEGGNLNGATCVSRGFDGGTLECGNGCRFDTSNCTSTSPDPGPIPGPGPSGGEEYCGNGNLDTEFGEDCDGTNLGQHTDGSTKTCFDFGFNYDDGLACYSTTTADALGDSDLACTHDTRACVSALTDDELGVDYDDGDDDRTFTGLFGDAVAGFGRGASSVATAISTGIRDLSQIVIEPLRPGISAYQNQVAENKTNNLPFFLILLSGLLAAIIAFFNIPLMTNLGATLQYLWRYLLTLITEPAYLLARKKKQWGVVYDALSKQPVPLAVVKLFSASDKRLLDTKVTGSSGRYYFMVDRGRDYFITVKANQYAFPSRYTLEQAKDDIYENLYKGEKIKSPNQISKLARANRIVTVDGEILLPLPFVGLDVPLDPRQQVNLNIPLDRQKGQITLAGFSKRVQTGLVTVNQYLDSSQNERIKEYHRLVAQARRRAFCKYLAHIGPLVALVSWILTPNWILAALLGVHVILLLLFKVLAEVALPRPWGHVYDKNSKQKLPLAVVRLFDSQFGKLLMTQVTISEGRYGFAATDNKFILTCEREGYVFPENSIKVASHKDELIRQNIALVKDREQIKKPKK